MRYCYIPCLLMVLSSCVRDAIPPCPALSVQVAVKDKNYFNVRMVEQEPTLSEELAFRAYVPTLYYRLCPLGSDEAVVEQELFEVTGEEKEYAIRFDDELPHGTYVLTVWGGLKDMSELDNDGNRNVLDLHPGGAEGEDVYMTNDTLVYDAWSYDYTVEMERTKGKLIVLATNLPDDIRWSGQSDNGLYRTVDSRFDYSDETGVNTAGEWTSAEKAILTKTVLSPSQHTDGTVQQMQFYDTPDRTLPAAVPEDVQLTMRRNELTVLKYVYEEGRFIIYLLVNGDWEQVHGMVID